MLSWWYSLHACIHFFLSIHIHVKSLRKIWIPTFTLQVLFQPCHLYVLFHFCILKRLSSHSISYPVLFTYHKVMDRKEHITPLYMIINFVHRLHSAWTLITKSVLQLYLQLPVFDCIIFTLYGKDTCGSPYSLSLGI